jgi:hypothetical protein
MTFTRCLVPAIVLCLFVHDSSPCGLRKGRRLRVWPRSENSLKLHNRASRRNMPYVRTYATVCILGQTCRRHPYTTPPQESRRPVLLHHPNWCAPASSTGQSYTLLGECVRHSEACICWSVAIHKTKRVLGVAKPAEGTRSKRLLGVAGSAKPNEPSDYWGSPG